MYPEDLRYTKEHEWVRVEGDTGTIGITDHAQKELGDVVFVETPKVGAHLEQGQVAGSVESVKAVSDIYSPVTGEVVEVNESLAQEPEKINQDPHGGAWLARIKLEKPAEIDALMTAAQYEEYVKAESH